MRARVVHSTYVLFLLFCCFILLHRCIKIGTSNMHKVSLHEIDLYASKYLLTLCSKIKNFSSEILIKRAKITDITFSLAKCKLINLNVIVYVLLFTRQFCLNKRNWTINLDDELKSRNGVYLTHKNWFYRKLFEQRDAVLKIAFCPRRLRTMFFKTV